MISSTDLKNGTTFLVDGKPHKVIKYTHQKIGRGGANIKVSMRSLETGNLSEQTFTPNTKFDEIITSKRPLQYLYKDSSTATFMDPNSYDQVEIPIEVLGSDLDYIKEGQQVDILFWDGKALSADIPPKVNLKIAETPPGVKGNSATNIFKPAKLENGISVKVPMFIKVGDTIKVDTRNGEYVERVN